MIAIDINPVKIPLRKLCRRGRRLSMTDEDFGVGRKAVDHGLHDRIHIGLTFRDGTAVPAGRKAWHEYPGIHQVQLPWKNCFKDALRKITLPHADFGACPMPRRESKSSAATNFVTSAQ